MGEGGTVNTTTLPHIDGSYLPTPAIVLRAEGQVQGSVHVMGLVISQLLDGKHEAKFFLLCFIVISFSVATLVLIIIKSPYKDQNRKTGPYLVLIFTFGPYFHKIGPRTVNLIRVVYTCYI